MWWYRGLVLFESNKVNAGFEFYKRSGSALRTDYYIGNDKIELSYTLANIHSGVGITVGLINPMDISQFTNLLIEYTITPPIGLVDHKMGVTVEVANDKTSIYYRIWNIKDNISDGTATNIYGSMLMDLYNPEFKQSYINMKNCYVKVGFSPRSSITNNGAKLEITKIELLNKNDSFVETHGGARIGFNLSNTPLSNLVEASSYTFCGTAVPRGDIKSISFGKSYEHVTSIPNYFLRSCINMESINLSGFKNVTHVGIRFLHDCRWLLEVDLRPMTQLQSTDVTFLSDCDSLKTIYISADPPPSLGTSSLTGYTALTSIYVPTSLVSAYKAAPVWSNFATIIKPYT